MFVFVIVCDHFLPRVGTIWGTHSPVNSTREGVNTLGNSPAASFPASRFAQSLRLASCHISMTGGPTALASILGFRCDWGWKRLFSLHWLASYGHGVPLPLRCLT